MPLVNTSYTIGGQPGVGSKFTSLANTAQQLQATEKYAKRVHISSHEANTEVVVIGDSNVVAGIAGDAAKSRTGFVLLPGGSLTIECVFLHKLYISSVVNGEGVTYTYET